MIRNQLNWDEYWRWENEEERTAAVYYDAQGVPQGFCIYWIAQEVFHIKEMVYITQEARVACGTLSAPIFRWLSTSAAIFIKTSRYTFC